MSSASAGKAIKYSGYIGMTLPRALEDDETTVDRLRSDLQVLEDLWQNICKQQRHRYADNLAAIPAMAQCFSFIIPPVNAQTHTLVGAIHGFSGS